MAQFQFNIGPGTAFIEVLIEGGSWVTAATCTNNSQNITHHMKLEQRNNPSRRVRAVDSSGRVLDILS